MWIINIHLTVIIMTTDLQVVQQLHWSYENRGYYIAFSVNTG